MKNPLKEKILRQRFYSDEYPDRNDVVLWDVLQVLPDQLIKVSFISKNSPWDQGVRIAVDAGKGYVEIVNKELREQYLNLLRRSNYRFSKMDGQKLYGQKLKEIWLWYEISLKEVILKCNSKEGLVRIYNVYRDERSIGSQMYKSGMLLQEEGNKITYYCHDVGKDVSFDKLVFSIEKLEQSA